MLQLGTLPETGRQTRLHSVHACDCISSLYRHIRLTAVSSIDRDISAPIHVDVLDTQDRRIVRDIGKWGWSPFHIFEN